MNLPPLSERHPGWDIIEFDPVTTPRMWLTMVIPGGTNPQNTTREKNQALFTGVYVARWLHESCPKPAGTGERASRSRQAGACNIVFADNSDNAPLVSAVGSCAAKKRGPCPIPDQKREDSATKALRSVAAAKQQVLETFLPEPLCEV